MKQLIKKRLGKKSNRGIYLQDRELKNTLFNIGKNFKYIIDTKNNKILIIPSEDETNNTVSKRQIKDEVKPVIDIRAKDALSIFKDVDYLQISMFEDEIIIEGFEKTTSNSISSSEASKIKQKSVKDITHLLSVKRKAVISIPKIELAKVVGENTNYTISRLSECISETIDGINTHNLVDLKEILSVPLSVVSLFSGAGVMDKGFVDNGYDIIFALDFEEDACKTYRYNIGNHIVHEDITKLDKNAIPKASIIIGGSPCQGFSNSNRVTNFLDNPKNLLVKEFIKTVQSNDACKVFVLENVPQLLTAGDGKFLQEIKDSLSDFQISEGVLCSADFGSAQKRSRAIVIGSKIGKIDLPKPIYKIYKTVREAFAGIHDGLANQNDFSKPSDSTIERMSYVPPGGNVLNIPEAIRPKGVHSSSYKRLEWDKPSITITNVRKSNITHPEYNRSLSVRECARLFGLSDDYVFLGKLDSKQQQIANAVPYELSYAVAKHIKKAILKYYVTQQGQLCY